MEILGSSFFASLLERFSSSSQGMEEEAAFVLSRQDSTGGFIGRAGSGDLYYTAFALKALAITGALNRCDLDTLSLFLENHPIETILDIVNMIQAEAALLHCGIESICPLSSREGLLDFIEAHRSSDGGYSRKKRSGPSSVYWTYLALLCYDAFGRVPPGVKRVEGLLRSRQRGDGGFSEGLRSGSGTTNATAAALACAALFLGSPEEITGPVLDFFKTMNVGPCGGFKASKAAPAPDLLSTFTVLLSLDQAHRRDDFSRHTGFIHSCRAQGMGYKAGPWDMEGDVEYTFYGLGALALVKEAGR